MKNRAIVIVIYYIFKELTPGLSLLAPPRPESKCESCGEEEDAGQAG